MESAAPTRTPVADTPIAVVTGAASGIGQALTTALLDRGHDVVAVDRSTAGIDLRAHVVEQDVRDADGMVALAARFAGRPASHVFANAGVGGTSGDVLTLGDDDWRWALEVNTIGAIRTLRTWWPHLVAGGGFAVATVSAAAMQTYPGAGGYRASKAALLAAMEGLHYEAAGSSVRVRALCPGLVRTDVLDVSRYPEGQVDAAAGPSPFRSHLLAAMPHAEPADAFAQRVLDGLPDAPFYWLAHPETVGWVHGRHRGIDNGTPFDDFTGDRS